MRKVGAILALLVLGATGLPTEVASQVNATGDARWTVDVATGGFWEAWDRNEASESLAGAFVAADRLVWRGFAVRGEGALLLVSQRGDDAWLRGFTIGARKRWARHRAVPLVDVAVGVSDATVPAPVRGTEFNYLAVIGVGAEIPVGGVLVTLSGRWFHVSNNGREGRHLNPDIQALGAVVGVGWKK
jgi:hypothetical protein